MSGFSLCTGLERLKSGTAIAVLLSGGVDSFGAAASLLRRGFQVQAFHLILSEDQDTLPSAQNAAQILGLDLNILDLKPEFEKKVISPFIQTYARGMTPSPCVACNPAVKFGLFLDEARSRGLDHVATGHYVGLKYPDPSPTMASGPVLARPTDRQKDQTYFLSRLTRETLAHCIFPLARSTKTAVREIAVKQGLRPDKESQAICFLAGADYREYLRVNFKDRLSRLTRPGDFVDAAGRVMGRHQGLYAYTVGQRRGLGLPGPEPYYVLELDTELNRVILGVKKEIYSDRMLVHDTVWNFTFPETFTTLVQVRSRHLPARSQVRLLADRRAEVVFDRPQPSVAAGQAAAFYGAEKPLRNIVLGGGWIEKSG